MSTIKVTGKTLEEAIKKGLAEFNCSICDVNVKIIQHPGVFSSGEVELTYVGETPSQKTAGSIMRNLEQKIVQDQKNRNQEKNKQQQNNNQNKKNQQPQKNNQQSNNSTNKNNKPLQPPVEKKSIAVTNKVVDNKQQQNNNHNKEKNTNQNNKQLEPQKQTPKDSGEQKPVVKESVAVSAEQIEKCKEKSATYLQTLLSLMNVEANLTLSNVGDEIEINIGSEDNMLIGYHGETLDALEYLTLLAANPGEEKLVHINLDCCGYRNKRLDSIKEMAIRQAEKAVKIGRPVNLEPMNSATRKVVHALLNDIEDVTTKSDGKEPNRYIVIFPKKKQNANKVSNNQVENKNAKEDAGKKQEKVATTKNSAKKPNKPKQKSKNTKPEKKRDVEEPNIETSNKEGNE